MIKINQKRKTHVLALSAVLSALITVLIIVGSVVDIIDIVVACACAVVVHICIRELGIKNAFLIYFVSAVLSFVFAPFRSCSLYYVAFFGYYPMIRVLLKKKIKKSFVYYSIVVVMFNVIMTGLFLLFKSAFGVSNEPPVIYVTLFITGNVFFVSFEQLIGKIYILYDYKIKKMFKK